MHQKSIEWNRAALRVQFTFALFARLYCKGGYDPDQPRDKYGKWTPTNSNKQPDKKEPLPDIPSERPISARLRNKILKEVAKWALKTTLQETTMGPVVGTLMAAMEVASWLQQGFPYIQAYLDAPKSLDELQQAVSDPQTGYDIHHIVEQTPAERSGFPRSMIDAPENLVRISTLQHWGITGWYMTKSADYGDLSPREYLRDKDWNERTRVGLDALAKYGALKR